MEFDRIWAPEVMRPLRGMGDRLEASGSIDFLKRFAPESFLLTASWRCHDAQGRLLGYTARYDKPANGSPAATSKKEVKPFTFCQGPNGRRE